jgi:phosphate transport system substrate-binding protein
VFEGLLPFVSGLYRRKLYPYLFAQYPSVKLSLSHPMKPAFMRTLACSLMTGLFMALWLGACSTRKNTLKVKGSDTLLPLTQKEAEIYAGYNPVLPVTVTGGGSGVGIASLIDGTTDIAMSSRSMRLNEKLRIQHRKQTSREAIIAYDALAVAVHPDNPVKKLTREQLEAIFTGKVSNWKEVGGPALPIVAYSRETSSGTYEFFKDKALKGKEFGAGVLLLASTGTVIQSLSQTPGAIGYLGLAYLNGEVKALEVSFDEGKTYVLPTMAHAKDKSYPIVRPLYYYYLQSKEERLKPYLDFVLSDSGQALVERTGYVPLR